MPQTPKGVGDHPAKAEMETMWRQGLRAKAIIEFLEENNYPPLKYGTVSRYGQRFWSESTSVVFEEATVEELAELVASIEDSGLGQVSKIAFNRKNDAKANIITTQSVEILPYDEEFDDEPPALDRAQIPAFNINISTQNKNKPKGWNLAVSLPDMQIGYAEHPDGTLEPTHDEQALDVAHQILGYYQSTYGIDLVVNQGDNLDLPQLSSHRSGPAYTSQRTLQASIDRNGSELALEREIVGPEADIVYLSANHENRLLNSLIDRLPSLVGLRRSGEDEVVFSVPYLCKFSEYGIIYKAGYPDAEYWANDGLRFEHGNATSSVPGATTKKYLRDDVSTVIGHCHRNETVYKTTPYKDSYLTTFAHSAGCLCRIDGFIPSFHTGPTEDGLQAAQKAENWQQGLTFIWYDDSHKAQIQNSILINNGSAVVDGQLFMATVDKFGNSLV